MKTQTQEALHKALKVLNCLNNDRVYETAWVKGAINACEEALAQPAQEPVAWTNKDFNGMSKDKQAMLEEYNESYLVPLYTHPAPSWQGLSDSEIVWLCPPFYDEDNLIANEVGFARAIEQALKEKNYG